MSMINQNSGSVDTSGPYIHNDLKVYHIMLLVVGALIPMSVISLFYEGLIVIGNIFIAVLSSVLAEYSWETLVLKKKYNFDGHAAVIGFMVCVVLPLGIPIWELVLAAVCASILGKQLFGGIGKTVINPVLVGWFFIAVIFPEQTQGGIYQLSKLFSGWEQQTVFDENIVNLFPTISLANIFVIESISIAEISSLAVLVGGILLLATRVTSIRVVVSYILSFGLGLLIWITIITPDIFSVQSLGVMLFAALFLAPDRGSIPVTKSGKFVFGVIAGLLASFLIIKTGWIYSCFIAIILTNALVPVINPNTTQRPFGT